MFLPTDLGVRRQLERMGARGDPASASALATAWAPFRTTALLHLWAEYLDPTAPGAVVR